MTIVKHSIKIAKKFEFEINNTSSYVLYMINITKGKRKVIDARVINSIEKSKEDSNFDIYRHI